jgi:acyl-CoA synthetase (AMP-forming)/AMP-acid ligase II
VPETKSSQGWRAHLPDGVDPGGLDLLAEGSLPAAWRRLAEAGPDRPALWTAGHGWVTRAELDAAGARVAGRLRRAGLAAGDRVLVSAATSMDLVVACLGALRLAGGTEGEVLLRGPNVFGGYWGNPSATAEAFDPDGWFRTGDLGSFDERGSLRIEGRSKELIITGGYNVHPREVEELLGEHPGVAEAAVVGIPSEEWGDQVTAFVVPADPAAPPDPGELLAFTAERLAAFKRPRVVHYVKALPHNALGKVMKHELRP